MNAFQPVIILTTTANQAEAEIITKALLEKHLAACVQYENIRSDYVWQGKVCSDNEIRLTIKSERRCYAEIEQIILQHHSYECPQILMLEVSGGLPEYLGWLQHALQI